MPPSVPLCALAGALLQGAAVLAAAPERPAAPLLAGLGEHHFPVTTAEPAAQRYFDQGLVLAWGFNHREAARSFREAARRDPACAMCWWGVALVLGPNINAGMDPADAPAAWAAISRARALKSRASARERAYIDALSTRYAAEPPAERGDLDRAYAQAMRRLAAAFPADLDAATLLAEALMDLHPWDYWTRDGQARPWTGEIVDILEGVIARAPRHPGALHLYIHAVEASPDPGRAEAVADRLGTLVPGAGHLVHMPSHVYVRVGRYHDAVLANEAAIRADDGYLAQCRAQGLYPVAYVPHNHHFLWYAAALAGAGEKAIAAARHLAAHPDPETMRQPGMGALQHWRAAPLYALVRFGRWEAVLREPKPDADLLYPNGVWHYARGVALARTGRADAAAAELAHLDAYAEDPELETVTIWDLDSTADVLRVARASLRAEIALARGDPAAAATHFRAAVQAEDALRADEPESWHFPTRLGLGEALLAAGSARAAERAFREDLARHPENGWALGGLARSLRSQGREAQARAVERRLRAAWRHADPSLAGAAR